MNADTLVVARLSNGNLARTITWNTDTDSVSEELSTTTDARRTERKSDLPTIVDYALAGGWTLDVLTTNDEGVGVIVELRVAADAWVTVGPGPDQVEEINRMTRNAHKYEVTAVLLDR